ncbi:MAG: alpha/beta fold hydrolase [Candidatus Limnocylindria bacterium]
MPDPAAVGFVAIPGGRIETFRLSGGPGTPLLVIGGVETGLRPLAGTESVLVRRWSSRAARRPVVVVGRPLPDDPADSIRMLGPRQAAESTAAALAGIGVRGPVAIEAESGGGRIALWLSVEQPQLVSRLVLASVASETPLDSPMAERMRQWIALAEHGRWGEFFAQMALQMKPAGATPADGFSVAARLQPKPATPQRFIAELRATLDPASFVSARLGEIRVPTLLLAGGQDQVVPVAATRLVADRIPGSRLAIDPDCGHTVRSAFSDYDRLVERFLAEGDPGPAP